MTTSLTEHARFYRNLENAREKAHRANKYDSSKTRDLITEIFALSSPGKVPYPWQLDVAEALLEVSCPSEHGDFELPIMNVKAGMKHIRRAYIPS